MFARCSYWAGIPAQEVAHCKGGEHVSVPMIRDLNTGAAFRRAGRETNAKTQQSLDL
jgi:hypothetical protein